MSYRRKRKKLGLAFPDELAKVAGKSSHFAKKGFVSGWEDNFLPNFREGEVLTEVSAWRLVFLASTFLIIFFGLFVKIFHLQIVQGAENRGLADSNRIQVRIIHAPRGVIYDRNGKVLAENNPGFRLKKEFVSRDAALELEAKGDPKFYELELDAIRSYPYGSLTSHILGYVGQISEEELKKTEYSDHRTGDRVGRAGIEQFYENILRGKDGAEIIEIDAQGKHLRTLRRIEPTTGQNIYLSVDIDLQKAAGEALEAQVVNVGSCCGAIVAENPQTGEILSLVSYPFFDANVFTDPKRNEEVTKYFSDESSPLLNRVTSGTYPPGSTFKIVSALAGLSSGKITAQTKFEDTGVMSLDIYKYANWYFTQYGKTEGLVDVVKALQRSNDIYFYQVGRLVGAKTLGETAKKMGLGKKLGIDLPGEEDGLIPNADWKKENIGEVWYPGDDLHMAIGQGFILTTPLQILAQTAFVAAGGELYQPHLATRITRPDGSVVKQFAFEPIVKDIFKKEDLNLVKKGLHLVPKEGGTAWPFFSFSVPTSGKTGTAEFGDPKGKTHAWYTAYAPVDDPKIAVTVLVEAGGEGSAVAAPIAKEIYTWYFNPDKNNIKSLDTYQIATESAKALGE